MVKKIVIIPTYNECDNITRMIDAVLSLEGGWHLLIVDDNSPDGTASLVKKYRRSTRLHLLQRTDKQGLGTAYLAGFRWVLERDYDLIFEMDCDFSHDPADLPRLAEKLAESVPECPVDVIVGSRYVDGVTVTNWPMSRLMLSYAASKFVKIVTGMPVNDATAGFVGYRREVLEGMNLDRVEMVGYGFQIEMKYTAWRKGFTVKELPIVFVDRKYGESKMSSSIFGEAFFGVLKLPFRNF